MAGAERQDQLTGPVLLRVRRGATVCVSNERGFEIIDREWLPPIGGTRPIVIAGREVGTVEAGRYVSKGRGMPRAMSRWDVKIIAPGCRVNRG